MPEVKKYKISEPYLDISCGLGEAPFWEQSRNSLRFVDILNKKVHFIDLTQGPSSHTQWDLEYSIGTTADIEGNSTEFVFGGKTGYGTANRETGEIRWIKQFWTDEERKPDGGGKPKVGETKEQRLRANDGAVDARGRFFVGTMNDPAVVGDKVTDEVSIPNGMSWSDDDKKVNFTDSPSGKIVQYPYDSSTGEIDWTKSNPLFTCPIEGCVPDGHCQDEEGHLWVACFGSGKVFRVAPDGQIVAEIECPTRCVTCPAFVGTELFITSAPEEEPEKYEWSKRYGGALFRIDVGVRGSPLNKFKMTRKA
nr:putative sugar lactone lactonase yvre [Quercus suber]